MENIIDRLDIFMNEKGLNNNQITVSANLSIGLIGKARESRKGLHSDTIEKILCAYADLNPTWFLTGKGQMIKNYVNEITTVNEKHNNYNSNSKHKCELCAEKEKLIESLQYTIKTQQDFIDCLKQQSPYDEGQKRKAG